MLNQALSKADHTCYAAVRNIPVTFHSSDLRCFFSQFIEEKGFSCFHFKHRPEEIRKFDSGLQESGVTRDHKSCVCIVAFSNFSDRTRCISMYNKMNWVNQKDDLLKEKCIILKVAVNVEKERDPESYLTRSEQKHDRQHAANEEFTSADLSKLSELHPPANVMPNGNVGTPTYVFLELIKQCKLPPRIIKKLGLIFPKTGSNRRYGNVPFNYDNGDKRNFKGEKSIKTATGIEIVNADISETMKSKSSELSSALEENNNIEKDGNSSDEDDNGGEEWDRHEALHSDVTSQERDKERLFEEEIELKWEKGGSGLVFYTDAQYWAEEEGDFDEETADDWDVDMSEYYGEEGDRDAKEFVQIMKEKRLREGKSLQHGQTSIAPHQVGSFEKHTKGSGRHIMQKFGWEDGKTLGSGRVKGLSEPIAAEGQSSRERKGFGYHGEKLQSSSSSSTPGLSYYPHESKASSLKSTFSNFPAHQSVEPLASHSYIFPQFRSNLSSVLIHHKSRTREERRKLVPGSDGIVLTTKYDDPLDIDVDNRLLRSQFPTALKRRKNIGPSQTESNKCEDFPQPVTPIKTGSKLVKRIKKEEPKASSEILYPDKVVARTAGSTSLNSVASRVKFVRPVDPAEHAI
ncbi:unnamed protein product [Clavelina lepadiformis]|uniref:G-patch domain-containing protein n=1 Tax=Clavelina lepadiformis TaxID=159417 RepID=A0ABP0GI68_CLALP